MATKKRPATKTSTATKKSKKTKFTEYKLKVETKSGDILPIRLTLYEAKDDRQGAQLVIADDLAIKGIWIINGSYGPFISWPSYKHGDEYREYVHPISAELRESLYPQIIKLSAFEEKDDEEDDEEDD